MSPHSRGAMRPRFANNPAPENQRAQGMPGAGCARSLGPKKMAARVESHHGHIGITDIPRAMVYGYFVLSPVIRIF
jgi:hypothetical protein